MPPAPSTGHGVNPLVPCGTTSRRILGMKGESYGSVVLTPGPERELPLRLRTALPAGITRPPPSPLSFPLGSWPQGSSRGGPVAQVPPHPESPGCSSLHLHPLLRQSGGALPPSLPGCAGRRSPPPALGGQGLFNPKEGQEIEPVLFSTLFPAPPSAWSLVDIYKYFLNE